MSSSSSNTGTGRRNSRLDASLGPRSSSSGMINSPQIILQPRGNYPTTGCGRPASASGQNFFPRIVSSPVVSNRGIRDMGSVPVLSPPRKRNESTASSSLSSAFADVSAGFSIPPSPSFDFLEAGLGFSNAQEIPTQTFRSLDRIDGGIRKELYERKAPKGHLLGRLKKRLVNMGRSLSAEALSVNTNSEDSEGLLDNMQEPPSSDEEDPLITARLLEKCSQNTFLIQFRRRVPCKELGISFATDEIGLYVSQLAKEKHLVSIQEYLQVKDRILSLQGVPCYHLSTANEIREVTRGCYIITLKIARPSRRR